MQEDEISSLRQAIVAINSRLTAIEARLELSAPATEEISQLTEANAALLKHEHIKVEHAQAAQQNAPDLLIIERIADSAPVADAPLDPEAGTQTGSQNGPQDAQSHTSSSGPAPETAAGTAGDAADAAPGTKKNLETRIGLYWLNTLGVGSLVIGIALLIIYSFQYFGPAAKIATGLIIAASMLGLGEWLEHRNKSVSWYARGLMGGGWSLAYFSVYAMHFIASVQLIGEPITAVCLLLAVAGMAIAHSLHKRSEIMATLAVVLGFITIPLTEPTVLTTTAAGILTLTTAYLCTRMHWRVLYFWGLCAAYTSAFATLLQATASAHVPVSPTSFNAMRVAFLLTNWLAFGAVSLYLPEVIKKGRARLIAGAIISALCFYFGTQGSVYLALGANEFLFPLLLCAVYLVMAKQLALRDAPAQSTTYLTLGTAFATLTIPQLFHDGQTTNCLLALEVLALTFLGLQNQIKSLRWFAYALCLVVGAAILFDSNNTYQQNIGPYPIRGSIITCLFGAIAFVAAGLFQRSEQFAAVQSYGERRFFFASYFLGGILLYALIPSQVLYNPALDQHGNDVANHWLPLLWVAQASSVVALGFQVNSRLIRFTGLLFYFVACCTLMSLNQNWSWPGTLISAALIYGSSYQYQKHRLDIIKNSPERFIGLIYSITATIVVTMLLGVKLQPGLVSAGWAIEGMFLLVAGFNLPQKAFRVMGLCVFGLVAGKLLLVDLAGAETIQRILSFIGAGVILLISSYAYSKFAQKLSNSGNKD